MLLELFQWTLNKAQLLAKVIQGVAFIDGVMKKAA